ncbi:MAG: branched-chain-amino-acid transaminase [Anaerolineaceae bacterium]|nr:branched-chain-amino-acid transaminase [Anaerolineaceae bacterium]
MERVVYINGRMLARNEAKISVFDHGLLYGDGVFEGIRIYGHKAFRLAAHTRRLFESARAIRLEMPWSEDKVNRAINDTIAANDDLTDGYVRVVVTRGVGTLGIDPLSCAEPQLIIIVDTITLYSDELYQTGLTVVTSSVIRNHPQALDPRIKSMNYLNNILAKIKAHDAGAAEALMFNDRGFVAEASGDNIFIVLHGEVLTPPTSAGILEGVTRNEVMDICRCQGRVVKEPDMTRDVLYKADECFLTGTAAEIVPVVSIDNRPVGDGKPGPVTREILAEFRRRTKGD